MRVRSNLSVLGLSVVLLTVGLMTKGSAEAEPEPVCLRCVVAVSPARDAGTIDVVARSGTSDRVPGRGDGSQGEAPGRTEWITIEEFATPACGSNGLNGPQALCIGVVSSCPADDQVRFWIWHRVTEHRLGPPRTAVIGAWSPERGSFCLGPDDPGVPDIGRVVSLVQVAFRSVPLPVFTTRTSPAPRTLVNLPTRFSAGEAKPLRFSLVLVGVPVLITATPVSWAWTFGDGTTGTTTGPSTEHVYARAGEEAASVRVTWHGSFSLGGSPEVFVIRAPVYVQGLVTAVDVRQARTELVDR